MPNDIRNWARIGASARLTELRREEQSIVKQFPELRAGRQVATRTPRRRKLSAAARKAISEAQKKRWAAQRADGGAKPAVGSKKK